MILKFFIWRRIHPQRMNLHLNIAIEIEGKVAIEMVTEIAKDVLARESNRP